MYKNKWIRICGLMVAFLLVLSVPVIGAEGKDDHDGKINLNTATREQLIDIGLDATIADQIMEMREENGEFVDIEELQDIDEVDAKTIRQLKKKIYIEAAKGCNC